MAEPLMRTIDLRSDTFTLPSALMRARISEAKVGDDYYGEDPAVRRLEDHCRGLSGKEAALFCTTGMLANQLAIASQTQPGDEIITEQGYHVNLYESGQYARYCQVVLNPRETVDGVLRPADVERAIASKPRESVYAQVRLVSLENTISSWQGKVFPFAEMERMRIFTRERGVRLHLDGARLWNAHVRTGIPVNTYAAQADTVSVCFSKCLGAPLGSVLMGEEAVIEQARRLRIWHGSGFHQAGFCAEAAMFALTHQLPRIKEDHRLAAMFAVLLAKEPSLGVRPETVETNMIYLDFCGRSISAQRFQELYQEKGILAFTVPVNRIRLVVSSLVDEADIRAAASILCRLSRIFS